nr:hypothetical protein BaRGS_021128 [Batillaria attramentaria]
MRYYRMTNFNYKLGGSWGPDPVRLWDSPEYPFPFDNGQQFDLNITAVADDVFAVYVDDIHYVDYQLPAPVSTITSFKFRDDLQVHYLDLWCVL